MGSRKREGRKQKPCAREWSPLASVFFFIQVLTELTLLLPACNAWALVPNGPDVWFWWGSQETVQKIRTREWPLSTVSIAPNCLLYAMLFPWFVGLSARHVRRMKVGSHQYFHYVDVVDVTGNWVEVSWGCFWAKRGDCVDWMVAPPSWPHAARLRSDTSWMFIGRR